MATSLAAVDTAKPPTVYIPFDGSQLVYGSQMGIWDLTAITSSGELTALGSDSTICQSVSYIDINAAANLGLPCVTIGGTAQYSLMTAEYRMAKAVPVLLSITMDGKATPLNTVGNVFVGRCCRLQALVAKASVDVNVHAVSISVSGGTESLSFCELGFGKYSPFAFSLDSSGALVFPTTLNSLQAAFQASVTDQSTTSAVLGISVAGVPDLAKVTLITVSLPPKK